LSPSCCAAALTIAGKAYRSRLLVGTGKYRDFDETRDAIDASGAEIVTVAIRRTNIGQEPGQPSLLDACRRRNTPCCRTPPAATPPTMPCARCVWRANCSTATIRCKLEVLGDADHAVPEHAETLIAAETLVKDGFEVMVYCSDDPIQAKMLEEIGCVAVMPLASLIGSGMGILNPWNLRLIIDNAKVPVIVDAGVGTASDAAIAMELGCDGVLMNTAIATRRTRC
jgi:thiazole synthase